MASSLVSANGYARRESLSGREPRWQVELGLTSAFRWIGHAGSARISAQQHCVASRNRLYSLLEHEQQDDSSREQTSESTSRTGESHAPIAGGGGHFATRVATT